MSGFPRNLWAWSRVVSKPGSATHENHCWRLGGEEKGRKGGKREKGFPCPTGRLSRAGYLASWPLPSSLGDGSSRGKAPLLDIPGAGVGSPPGSPRAGVVG